MSKKVILINVICPKDFQGYPKTVFDIQKGPHFPLGLAFVGSYLKKMVPDISIKILDDQILKHGEIEKEIEKDKPDIVGISSLFVSYKKSLDFARVAKKYGAMVVMGGHYATALHKEILENRGQNSKDYCVDVVIRGAGEKAFFSYVSGVSLNKINNLSFLKDGLVKKNDLCPVSFSESFIDFGIFNPKIYFEKYQKRFPTSNYKNPFVVLSQKGCAWRAKTSGGCLFCSLTEKQFFTKKPNIVWEEINTLLNNHEVDYVWDVSDDLLADKNWFNLYCKESKKYKEKPFLKIQSRIDNLLNEEAVKKLTDLQTGQLFLGIESNDDNSLRLMKKGITSAMNEKAVDLLIKYRVPINAYFILGNPGESKKGLLNTIKIAEKIAKSNTNNFITPNLFSPIPGSFSYQMLIEKTGDKYLGKDIIEWKEAGEDWIKNFCDLSRTDIIDSLVYMRKLSHSNVNAFSF